MADTSILDADTLLATARAATSLDSLGADTWRDGLVRLIDALKSESRLNDIGVQIAAGEIQMYLANRLGIVDWHARNPELAREDVVPPIFIVGQGRTGTTI